MLASRMDAMTRMGAAAKAGSRVAAWHSLTTRRLVMFSETVWQRIYDSPTLTITVAKVVDRDELCDQGDDHKGDDWSLWRDDGSPAGQRRDAA